MTQKADKIIQDCEPGSNTHERVRNNKSTAKTDSLFEELQDDEYYYLNLPMANKLIRELTEINKDTALGAVAEIMTALDKRELVTLKNLRKNDVLNACGFDNQKRFLKKVRHLLRAFDVLETSTEHAIDASIAAEGKVYSKKPDRKSSLHFAYVGLAKKCAPDIAEKIQLEMNQTSKRLLKRRSSQVHTVDIDELQKGAITPEPTDIGETSSYSRPTNSRPSDENSGEPWRRFDRERDLQTHKTMTESQYKSLVSQAQAFSKRFKPSATGNG